MDKLILDDGLNTLQVQTIAMLSSGTPITATALELGIDRKTIYRYLENPVFKKELERTIDNNISILMLGAVSELSEIMANSLNNKDKLKAIELIFRANDRFGANVIIEEKKTDIKVDIDDMLIQLETL